MKKLIATSAVLAAAAVVALAGTPALAANVGVSIGISQPGVYGRVDIGRFPQPELIVQQPVLVARPVAPVAPAYLWVPPEHRQNWRRYCGEYRACGTPVYFVRDDWYGRQVRPYGPGGAYYRNDWHDGRREWHDGRRDGRDGRRDWRDDRRDGRPDWHDDPRDHHH